MAVPNKRYYIEKLQILMHKTEFIHNCYRLTYRKTAKTETVNLVAEHVGYVTMCSTTKFTVKIFAVFRVYNTCI